MHDALHSRVAVKLNTMSGEQPRESAEPLLMDKEALPRLQVLAHHGATE